MTSPPRSVAEALLIPFEAGTRRILLHSVSEWERKRLRAGTRRISLRPIFGRARPIHQHGSALFLASFNPS